MPQTVLAVLAVLCMATSVHAQHSSAEGLANRIIHRRAVEAVI
jgi:hypothetical protein